MEVISPKWFSTHEGFERFTPRSTHVIRKATQPMDRSQNNKKTFHFSTKSFQQNPRLSACRNTHYNVNDVGNTSCLSVHTDNICSGQTDWCPIFSPNWGEPFKKDRLSAAHYVSTTIPPDVADVFEETTQHLPKDQWVHNSKPKLTEAFGKGNATARTITS